MRNKILELLEITRNNVLTKDEILRKLSNPNFTMQELQQELVSMLEDKLIYCTNSRLETYTLNPFKKGTFRELRNVNIVYADNMEILIDHDKTNGAMNGDKVLIRVTDFNTLNGSVKEIIERHGIIAEIKTINSVKYAVVGKEKYKIELPKNIVDGMLIGIKIDKTKSGKYYHATLDKVLGHKNAPRLEERKILYIHDFPDEFSLEVQKEMEDFPFEVTNLDIKDRKDLRNKQIFTIDGDDTKDIDDAISLEKLENGNSLLGVHIADVSHYVKEGTAIDKEAMERGTSVYMPGVVNPMYPYELSNGICSLNPNVDRLTLTCSMEIDSRGVIVDYNIYKSVISSNIQMTYKNVNKILEKNIIPKEYEEYSDTLKEMETLAKLLEENRKSQGMLDFATREIKIDTDLDGNVTNIGVRTQNTGEEIIEQFMIAMNECVATYIYNMGLHSIYRVHDVPNEEKLKRTINIIKNYGEEINAKINYHNPKTIESILESLKESKKFDIYSMLILRSMSKASYKTYNLGHFGLGVDSRTSNAYTHSTAPIRRYPDTIIGRIISNILEGNLEKLQSEQFLNKLVLIADHSSKRELEADDCERDANKLKMAEYMSNYIGKCFDARIVGFTFHGMFVELDNLVEGRIGYETMDDYYRYNEDYEILIGERNKKTYRLGDKVYVQLVKASKISLEIDFEIVKR